MRSPSALLDIFKHLQMAGSTKDRRVNAWWVLTFIYTCEAPHCGTGGWRTIDVFNAIVSSEKSYLCKDPGLRSMRKVMPRYSRS